MPAGTTTGMGEASDAPTLLRLLTWFSPAFPIGAFAYSGGLEAAVAEGRVRSAEAVRDWIAALAEHGNGWNDLVLFAEAYRAARNGDAVRSGEAAVLGIALASSAERRAETLHLGEAFARAGAAWGGAGSTGAPYPVAAARLAAGCGVSLEEALLAFAHAGGANLVSAATRLVPLGQSEAVPVLRQLEAIIARVAVRAAVSTLDDLGSAAIGSEIAAMRHETLAHRLFRS